MHYSIGHATVINPKVTKDGYFTGLLFDKYDFERLDETSGLSDNALFTNNYAYGMQKLKYLMNYYTLVPVRFKI